MQRSRSLHPKSFYVEATKANTLFRLLSFLSVCTHHAYFVSGVMRAMFFLTESLFMPSTLPMAA